MNDYKGWNNAEKTHCLRGHPFDEENTAIRADGARSCRTCARERMRGRRARDARLRGVDYSPAMTHAERGRIGGQRTKELIAKGKAASVAPIVPRQTQTNQQLHTEADPGIL